MYSLILLLFFFVCTKKNVSLAGNHSDDFTCQWNSVKLMKCFLFHNFCRLSYGEEKLWHDKGSWPQGNSTLMTHLKANQMQHCCWICDTTPGNQHKKVWVCYPRPWCWENCSYLCCVLLTLSPFTFLKTTLICLTTVALSQRWKKSKARGNIRTAQWMLRLPVAEHFVHVYVAARCELSFS